MLLLRWALPAACFVSAATAFYPYRFKDDHSEDDGFIQARRSIVDSVSKPSLSIPLRRVPVKRDNKYNVITAAKPSATDSAGIAQDGTDFSYFSPFTFGDGTQQYYMLIDTGASNTWVMGGECTTDACTAHNTLGPSDSSTLKVTQDTFGISYGTGSVGGDIASDTVHFAGLSAPLTFGLGTNVSSEFLSYPMDGIVGLGRGDSTSPAIDAPPFLDALKNAGIIKSHVFGVNLWRTSDGGTNDGEINFGAPDSSKFTGSLTYSSLVTNNDGFYEIPVDDASVDGKSIGFGGDRTALIDTGTSFVLMPAGDADKLHALIKGSAQDGETYTIPCDWKGTVSLTFNGEDFDISYKDVVGHSTSSGQCNSNIVGRQTFSPTQWLIGDVFLKNVYSVFDKDGSRVGFGRKGTASSSSSQSQASATSSKASSSAAVASTTTQGMYSPSITRSPSTAHNPSTSQSPSRSTSQRASSSAAISSSYHSKHSTRKHSKTKTNTHATVSSSTPKSTHASKSESPISSATSAEAHHTETGTLDSPQILQFSDFGSQSLGIPASSYIQPPSKRSLVFRIVSTLFLQSATPRSKHSRPSWSNFFAAASEEDLWKRDLGASSIISPERDGKGDRDFDDWISAASDDMYVPLSTTPSSTDATTTPDTPAPTAESSNTPDSSLTTSAPMTPASTPATTTPMEATSTSPAATDSDNDDNEDDYDEDDEDEDDDDTECDDDDEDEDDSTSSSATSVPPVTSASMSMPMLPGESSADLNPHPDDGISFPVTFRTLFIFLSYHVSNRTASSTCGTKFTLFHYFLS